MTRDERFAAVMAKVCAVYQQEITTPLLEAFAETLADMSIEDIERAATRHIKTSPFFPKPADFRRQAEGTVEDRARLAWSRVKQAMDRFGTWHTVRFDDPRIHYAVEALGGWIGLCETPDDEMVFRGKDFEKHYADADRMGIGWDRVPPVLQGYIWRENLASGYEDKLTPVMQISGDGQIVELPPHEVKALKAPALVGQLLEKWEEDRRA